jgi:hypothetical protein
MAQVGGDDIDAGAGTKIPIYIFLLNGWRLRPQEASHTLSVTDGIILVDGGGDPFVNTLSSYIVRINYQQPVQAISFATGGGSGATPQQIWEYANRALTDKAGFAPTSQQIWEYVTRTLTQTITGGGASAAEIWSASGRSLDGDVGGKVLGGGSSGITGVGVRAQTENGQQIASIFDVNQLVQATTYAVTGAGAVVVSQGTVISGGWSNTLTHNDTYLQIAEVVATAYGVQVDFDFTVDTSLVPGHIQFFGRYEGGAQHDVEVYAYDNVAASWEQLSTEANELDNANQDYFRQFVFSSNHVVNTTGLVRIRLQHNSHGGTLNGGHRLYIDKLSVVLYKISPSLTAAEVWAYALRTLTAGTRDAEIDLIKAKTDNLPGGIKKNVAMPYFTFSMISATDGKTLMPGLTITAQRKLDAGVFASCANAPVGVGNGVYLINLEAADMNGDIITFKFTAAGALDRIITIKTNP